MYGSVWGYVLVRKDSDRVGSENDNNDETRWMMSAIPRHSNNLHKRMIFISHHSETPCIIPVKCLVTFLSGVEHKRYQIETNTQAANGQHQNSLHKKLEKVIIFMFAQIIELIIEC